MTAGVQQRLRKDVVVEASTEKTALGFTPDEPLGTVLSDLVHDGIEYRRLRQRERARAETYAAWAQDDELHDDVRQNLKWSIAARSR